MAPVEGGVGMQADDGTGTGLDAFLRRSLLAAGVGGWEWEPRIDIFRWTPETAGLLALSSGGRTLGLAEFLAYVHTEDREDLQRTLHASLAERVRFRTQFRISNPGDLLAGSSTPVTGRASAPPATTGAAPDAAPGAGQAPARAQGRSDVLAGRSPGDDVADSVVGSGPTEAEVDDGSRIVRMVGSPRTEGGAEILAGVLEDVTDATRARRAFTQTQHLASLGQLAAGLAHDFNNLLTVITMRADMLRSGAAGSAQSATEVAEDAKAILEAADRASALTRQLMLFGGHQAANAVEIALVDVVGGLRTMVDGMRGGAFETEYVLDPAPPVSGERQQLEQIVVNLALNARDALREVDRPAGRPMTLSIRVRPVAAGSPELGSRGEQVRPRHSWVVLQVSDTGAGMDPAIRARARDPFFTTKPVGLGTGLGLSVVHGIAEQLGGWLTIDSERGAGTTIRVVLPAALPTDPEPGRPSPATHPAAEGTTYPAAAATTNPATSGADPRPRPLVLVVDDDDAVRAVTARSLAAHGFDVVSESGAQGALDALDARPEITALVSDVVMPGMSGTELAARVLVDHPDVPILLVTGYAPPAGTPSSPRLWVVTKPLTGARLAASLRELLARVHGDPT